MNDYINIFFHKNKDFITESYQCVLEAVNEFSTYSFDHLNGLEIKLKEKSKKITNSNITSMCGKNHVRNYFKLGHILEKDNIKIEIAYVLTKERVLSFNHLSFFDYAKGSELELKNESIMIRGFNKEKKFSNILMFSLANDKLILKKNDFNHSNVNDSTLNFCKENAKEVCDFLILDKDLKEKIEIHLLNTDEKINIDMFKNSFFNIDIKESFINNQKKFKKGSSKI